MSNKLEIKAKILNKLARRNIFGAKHSSFDYISSGFPKHLAKKTVEVGKELINEGVMLSKPTHYGLEISLNPKRAAEIKEIIQKYLK